MYEQSARDPSFAGTCARCGSKVSGQVSSCPHCGAPARYIFGERGPMKRPGAVPPGPPDGRADVPRSGRPGASFASNDSVYPYDEVRRPAPVGATGGAGGVSRKGVKKGAVLALLAVV